MSQASFVQLLLCYYRFKLRVTKISKYDVDDKIFRRLELFQWQGSKEKGKWCWAEILCFKHGK